jgi:hypothetical protein
VLFEIFSNFTLGKVRDLNYELLFALVKGKIGKSRGKKKFGGMGREIFNTFLLVGLGVVRF